MVKSEETTAHLRQLLRDAPKHMVIELPGLSEVLHILCRLVLSTPIICLRQITPIGLQERVETDRQTDRQKKRRERKSMGEPKMKIEQAGFTHSSTALYTAKVSQLTWLKEISLRVSGPFSIFWCRGSST